MRRFLRRPGRAGLGYQAFAGPFTLDPPSTLIRSAQPARHEPSPLVVAVQGATWMLGHELFLAVDIRVAAARQHAANVRLPVTRVDACDGRDERAEFVAVPA
jgi:hypothetical protein